MLSTVVMRVWFVSIPLWNTRTLLRHAWRNVLNWWRGAVQWNILVLLMAFECHFIKFEKSNSLWANYSSRLGCPAEDKVPSTWRSICYKILHTTDYRECENKLLVLCITGDFLTSLPASNFSRRTNIFYLIHYMICMHCFLILQSIFIFKLFISWLLTIFMNK
jgi:hypothetical protein